MKKSNTNKIFLACPIIYRGRKDVLFNSMRYGFQCRDGWFLLIFELSKKIEFIVNTLRKNGCRPVDLPVVSEVKEKDGMLLFCVCGSSEEINKLIERAEEKAVMTCERCGEPGSLRQQDWPATLCKACLLKTSV